MNLIEQGTVIHFHQHRLDEFGYGHRSLGWKNQRSQIKRFEVINQLVDFHGCSVLDAGCGQGDFFQFLLMQRLNIQYVGLDIQPHFVEYASKRFRDRENARFYQADFSNVQLPLSDIVVLSGALSYKTQQKEYWKDAIERLYRYSRICLIFNFLNAETFPEHPLLTGYDVQEVIDFCRKISKKLTTRTGYLEHDVTLCLHW